MDDYADFGELLNQHLEANERSASWLARRLRVSSGAVSRWLSGENYPQSAEVVQRIADILLLSQAEYQTLLEAAGYVVHIQPPRIEQAAATGAEDEQQLLFVQNVQQNIHQIVVQPSSYVGSAPPLPTLVIGREEAMMELKTRLNAISPFTAIRGWPGVGKTTIAAALAHDTDVARLFPDGVLWTSLGPTPSLLSTLAAWGRSLGTDELLQTKSTEEATALLTALLRNKRMLLIVDDVWQAHHVIPFRVGGQRCAMIITTRESGIAQALAPTPQDVYILPVLTEEKALELLATLAPKVVTHFPGPARELVRELEGLPLALQVAGHMLNVEFDYGFGVQELLVELREGAKLLSAIAPADRTDLVNETIPTVAVLFQRSTDRLDKFTRDCFAYLGVFAPKPATFDLAAMKSAWQVDDPKPIARTLADRGLLEPIPSTGRFQMHALLVMHAKSMLA